MLRLKNLGSGSTGNATVVEGRSGNEVRRLLIDCGFGLRQLQARLAQAQLQQDDLDAVFITHEHSDHVGCVLSLAARYRIPVWMSEGTHAAIGAPDMDGLLRVAHDLQAIDLGTFQITPFTVPHDAREPLQVRCSDGASHLAVLTDLGHASAHVLQQLEGCHALMIEANHDPELAGSIAVSQLPQTPRGWPLRSPCQRGGCRNIACRTARRAHAGGCRAPERPKQSPGTCATRALPGTGLASRGDHRCLPSAGNCVGASGLARANNG